MKKLISILLPFLFCCAVMSAESMVKSIEVAPFQTIKIEGTTKIIVLNGPSYKVEAQLDNRVYDIFKAYNQGSELIVSLEESDYPDELKKQLKKSKSKLDSSIVRVYVPKDGQCDRVMLANVATLHFENFEATSVQNFNIKISNKAYVDGKVKTNGNIYLEMKNAGKCDLDVVSNNLKFIGENSATANILSSSPNVEVSASNACKLNLTGKSKSLIVVAKNVANVNAEEHNSKNVIVDLSGATCSLVAELKLTMNLSSGAKLIYKGNPELSIDKIVSSSVSRK